MKYKPGDLVTIFRNHHQYMNSYDSMLEKRETGIVLGGTAMSVYDTMSNGRSTSTFQYSVMLSGNRHSFFEEELEFMKKLNEKIGSCL
jgi:hypothetical protein|tara:strand:- start:2152 stop:2415 length:264 start_codon:yes stop_codon:yes gene_type:complete